MKKIKKYSNPFKKIITKIKSFFYFYENIEITEWEYDRLYYVYWIRFGFRREKYKVSDKKMTGFFERIKEAWRMTDYYLVLDNDLWYYDLDNKNIIYKFLN